MTRHGKPQSYGIHLRGGVNKDKKHDPAKGRGASEIFSFLLHQLRSLPAGATSSIFRRRAWCSSGLPLLHTPKRRPSSRRLDLAVVLKRGLREVVRAIWVELMTFLLGLPSTNKV